MGLKMALLIKLKDSDLKNPPKLTLTQWLVLLMTCKNQ